MEYEEVFSLEDKVALATGASHGIGFTIASALGEAGANVAFNRRNEEHLSRALGQHRSEGIDAAGSILERCLDRISNPSA